MKRKLIAAAVLLLALAVLTGLCTAEETPATPMELTEAEMGAEPTTEPATEPATEPETESATESETASATEPETESATESETEPATESKIEPATEPETEPAPACAHENVNTVIYFFDSPSYTSLSAASHRVSGPGVVAKICRDCGATLSEETVTDAEEVRPHSMKKGVCALCGYRAQTEAKQDKKDAPGERTLMAQSDGSGVLFLTLTEQDLAALENAKVKTLLVRGEHGKAVVAVDVREIRQEARREAASFSIEMAEREDGSLFAGLSLSNAPGRKDELDIEGVTLRFYGDKDEEVRIVLDPTDGDRLTETEGKWDDNGYWFVPYVSEGNYVMIR